MGSELFAFAFLYQKYPMTAAAMYGTHIRYKIPEFNCTPYFSELAALASMVALHIAHWADAKSTQANIKINSNALNFNNLFILKRIKRTNHKINHNSGDSYE